LVHQHEKKKEKFSDPQSSDRKSKAALDSEVVYPLRGGTDFCTVAERAWMLSLRPLSSRRSSSYYGRKPLFCGRTGRHRGEKADLVDADELRRGGTTTGRSRTRRGAKGLMRLGPEALEREYRLLVLFQKNVWKKSKNTKGYALDLRKNARKD